MDKFIGYVITDKLTNAADIIFSQIINEIEYYKLYHYFIYFYTKNKISDNVMYLLTYLLLHKYKVIKPDNIYDSDYILAWHIFKGKNNSKTFVVLNLYNSINAITERIERTMIFLRNNSKNIKKILGKHKKTSTLKKIIKESFIDYMIPFNDKIILNNIMMASVNKISIYEHSLEIENRLIIIIKYFGINLLQLIGVDIIDNKYYNMLSFEEKTDYYRKCINLISDTGKNIYNLLELKKRTKKLNKGPKKDYLQYEKNAKNELCI